MCVWESYNDLSKKEDILQGKLDSAKSNADQLIEREKYRASMQNRKMGGGCGDYYGRRSASDFVLRGFSDILVVVSDALVFANGTP